MHGCTIHNGQSQLVRLNKKKKEKNAVIKRRRGNNWNPNSH